MRINNLDNQYINFSKSKIANVKIGSKGHNYNDVSIFQVDNEADFKELERAYKSVYWKDNFYADILISDFYNIFNANFKIYFMQDKKGRVFSYCITHENKDKKLEIDFLETSPRLARYNNLDSKPKWIGETMLTCLAKKYNKDVKIGYVDFENPGTVEFYQDNLGFDYDDTYSTADLPKEKIPRLESQNQYHTGGTIDIVG